MALLIRPRPMLKLKPEVELHVVVMNGLSSTSKWSVNNIDNPKPSVYCATARGNCRLDVWAAQEWSKRRIVCVTASLIC